MPPGAPSNGNFGRGQSMSSGFGNLLGYGGNAPGIDSDSINALLQQFGGISMPESGPSGLFENTGWGQNHPRASGGLDNALIALSNMGEPSQTIGGNISNVARGLQSIGPTRMGQQVAPTMMALDMAQKVAGLKQASANIGREGAMASYYSSRNQTQEDVANMRMNAALMKQQMLAGKEGMILANGQVGLPDLDEDGSVKYVPHPEIDPKEFKAQQHRQRVNGMLGNSVTGMAVGGILESRMKDPSDPNTYVDPKNPKRKGSAAYYEDMYQLGVVQPRAIGPNISNTGRDVQGDKSDFRRSNQTTFKDILSGPGSAAIREKRVKQRAQDIFQTNNDWDKAQAQAQQEETEHRGKLLQAQGEFSLLDEDQQRKVGGPLGYLASKGYDPTTDKFSAPRTGAQPSQPNGASNVMGGANTPTLSPGVQAIIDSMKK